MSKKAKVADLESSLQEISELIEKMENHDITLEQSLNHFERGIGLINNCQKLLAEAEQKVQLLIRNNPSGEGEPSETLVPYASDAGHE